MMKPVQLIAILLLTALFPPAALSAEDKILAEGDWGAIYESDRTYLKSTAREPISDASAVLQLARNALGANKARAVQLDKDAQTRWQLWVIETSLGAREVYERNVAAGIKVTEEEVQETYKAKITQFQTPGTYSFQYIFSDTTEHQSPEGKEAARKKLEEAHKELLATLGSNPARPWIIDSTTFANAAKKYSEVKGDPTRTAGPFKLEEPLQPVIRNMALSLKPGEISPVFATRHGFEILRLESLVETVTQEYKDVSFKIRQMLVNEKRIANAKVFMENLRADKDRYEINEDHIACLLPGAHSEVPSGTAAVRVGKKLWAPEQVSLVMNNLYRREWMMARNKTDAISLVWRSFVLPQIVHEDALAAGYVDRITEQARFRCDSNMILCNAWMGMNARHLAASMPAITTPELMARYETVKEENKLAAQYRMVILSEDIPELRSPEKNPAKIEFIYRDSEKRLLAAYESIQKGASPEAVAKATESTATPIKFVERWVSKGLEFNDQAWKQLEALPMGSWLDKPVRTSKGVAMAKVLDYEGERLKSFEEVGGTLRTEIQNERLRDAQVQTLKQLLEEARSSMKVINP